MPLFVFTETNFLLKADVLNVIEDAVKSVAPPSETHKSIPTADAPTTRPWGRAPSSRATSSSSRCCTDAAQRCGHPSYAKRMRRWSFDLLSSFPHVTSVLHRLLTHDPFSSSRSNVQIVVLGVRASVRIPVSTGNVLAPARRRHPPHLRQSNQ